MGVLGDGVGEVWGGGTGDGRVCGMGKVVMAFGRGGVGKDVVGWGMGLGMGVGGGEGDGGEGGEGWGVVGRGG